MDLRGYGDQQNEVLPQRSGLFAGSCLLTAGRAEAAPPPGHVALPVYIAIMPVV